MNKFETTGIRKADVDSFPGATGIAILCLLSLFLFPVALPAGDFALSAGTATGAYAARLHSLAGELSWRPAGKWDLSAGYIDEQDTPCGACGEGGYVRFQTPEGVEYEYVDPQDAEAYFYLSGTRTFTIELGKDTKIILGAGLMVADKTTVLLSQALNFSLQAGIEYKRVRFQYRHFSNAGTNLPNYGQNLMLIGYQF